MAKTAGQKKATEAVQKRLLTETPLRVDAVSKTSGGERGGSKRLSETHPSLEGVTTALDNAGLAGGTITTASGLQIDIAQARRGRGQPYTPSAEGLVEKRKGKEPPPPMQEGISQKYVQQIGHDHGPEKAAEITAEADAVARQVNPLRSDGHVDLMTSMHLPSMGGNRIDQYGRGGSVSRLAKSADENLPQSKIQRTPIPKGARSNFPSLSRPPVFADARELALHSIGYGEDVQARLLSEARDRITRRQGRGHAAALSDVEITARAHGQVQEHLDEALHGTRASRRELSDVDSTDITISDLAAQQAGGGVAFDVRRAGPSEGAGLPPVRAKAQTGMGMTKSRTPRQRAQRLAVKQLVSKKGGWAALQDADGVEAARQQDLEVLDIQQRARRANVTKPEQRITDSAGADPEAKAWAQAQPVHSTGPHPAHPSAEGAPPAQPLVGIPARKSSTTKILPPAPARGGEISPVPPDLKTEPVRLGRTRAERGLSDIRETPERGGGLAPSARNYSSDIAAYEASRSGVTQATPAPLHIGTPKPAPKSNVTVAQTETVPATTTDQSEVHPVYRAQKARFKAQQGRS